MQLIVNFYKSFTEGIRKTCLNANYHIAHIKFKVTQRGNVTLAKVTSIYCMIRQRSCVYARAREAIVYDIYGGPGSIKTLPELIAGSLITRLDLTTKYDDEYSTGASILRRKI